LSAVPLVFVALVVALFLKEKPLGTRDAQPQAGQPATAQAGAQGDAQPASESVRVS
jgi:hypothetical protein